MAAFGNGHIMLKQLNYYWRIAGTAISFFTFGLSGLILRILIFPMLNFLIWQPRLRIMAARKVIRFAFRCFIEFMQFLGVLRYKIVGLEKLERTRLLILANHPTLIDTVFLMAFVKQAGCIVKNTLWRNPFTHSPVRAAGYICNANGPGLIDDCVTALHNGSNLIIFPEGTRTPMNGTIKFKRGAANTAIRAHCNITPVIIRCTPLTLSKGEKWWQVPAVPPYFTIEVKEDIEVHAIVGNIENQSLATRKLTDYLQNYFMRESQSHATT